MITLHGTFEAVPPADYIGDGPRLELRDGQASGESYDEAYGTLQGAAPGGYRLIAVRAERGRVDPR